MLTNFNDISIFGRNVAEEICSKWLYSFHSLCRKTYARVLCTIKHKNLLRNYVMRRTENDAT